MDHIKPYDVPLKTANNIQKKQIFGDGGYIPFGDGSMSLVELYGEESLTAMRCAKEVIYYIVAAENAFVAAGESPDALDEPEPLKKDDVVIIAPDEWYVFCTKGESGRLLTSEFVPDPQAEFFTA